MKVTVLAKAVPDTESSLSIAEGGKDIKYDKIKMILNPYDEYAVEEAIKIAKEKKGSARVISFGGPEAEDALRTSIAMGISDVFRIENADGSDDCFMTASVLAKAMEGEEFDMILVGRQAFDDEASSVGPLVAEFLKVPFVSNVIKIEIGEGIVILEREGPGGKEVIESPLPCVLSCQKGLNKPRYPKLMGLMKAKKKKIEVKTLEDLGISAEEADKLRKTEIVKLSRPAPRPPGVKLSGDPAEIAEKLAAHLVGV